MIEELHSFSIKEAKKILGKDAKDLTDNEVKEIVDWLYEMADIAIEIVEKSDKNNE